MTTIEGMHHPPQIMEQRVFDRERYRQEISRVAYVVHRIRHLTAPDDPYQAELIAGVPAEELAKRDWILAESIVRQGNKIALQTLDNNYAALLSKQPPVMKQAA